MIDQTNRVGKHTEALRTGFKGLGSNDRSSDAVG